MTRNVPPTPPPAKDDRQARLAEQLRANLHRRKAQARAVAAGDQAREPGTELPKTDLPKL